MTLTASQEIQALQREIEELRAHRSQAADLSTACEVPRAATDNEAPTSSHHSSEWAEIKQQLAEMAHEIEVAARNETQSSR